MPRPSTNPTLISALAAEIKARRGELGLSQEELALRCELDRPFISLIEVGRKQPTISVLWRLAAGLELHPSEFALRIDDRHIQLEKAQKTRAFASESGK